MNVTIAQEDAAGIATLHVAPQGAGQTALPTVIVLHSFGVSKELVCYFGHLLALAGLRGVLPEAPLHGDRFDGDVVARQRRFWEVTSAYIAEVETVRGHYADRGLVANPDCIGIGGTSMGGFAALGATARYDWIGATAAYMGTAYFTDAARTIFPPFGVYGSETRASHDRHMAAIAHADPSARLDRLADRPIFLWHGQRDDVVPFAESLRLEADLAARGGAGKLEVLLDPLGSHRVTDVAARRGVAFLKRWLT